MFKADRKASRSQKKYREGYEPIFVSGLRKPIKVQTEINRAFNQKKQNQICAGCNRAFSAFCPRETATKTRQKKIRPSVRLDPARLVETQRWHCPSVYRCYRPALCGRSSSGLFQSR